MTGQFPTVLSIIDCVSVRGMSLTGNVRRLIIIGVVLAVLGAAAYAFITVNAQNNAQKPNIRQVSIDRGDLTLGVNATGTIAAAQTASLSFDNPGVVSEIDVEEGQHVAKGDVLARQDAQGYQLAVTQAQATLRAAQLMLDQVQAPPSDRDLAVAQANVKAAQDAYASLAGSVDPNAITAAQDRLQQAQIAYQDAVQHRKDTGGQFSTNSSTYQLALAQEGQASFGVQAAQLQLQILQRGVDGRLLAAAKAKITLAQSELARLKAGPLQAQIDRAKLGVQQAQMALDQANQQVSNTELRAPFAGDVSLIGVKVGALSVGAIPAVVVTDTSQLHMMIQVDEIDIGQVHEGEPVSLALDALPGQTLSGHVTQVALTANQALASVVTYAVQVAFDPTQAPIKVGMTVSASITVRKLQNVLRVPNIYVRLDQRNNQSYVESGQCRRHPH